MIKEAKFPANKINIRTGLFLNSVAGMDLKIWSICDQSYKIIVVKT
jgi:hypothetical protein